MTDAMFILPCGERRGLDDVRSMLGGLPQIDTTALARFLARNMSVTAVFVRSSYWHIVYCPKTISCAANAALTDFARPAPPARLALEYFASDWRLQVQRYTPAMAADFPLVNRAEIVRGAPTLRVDPASKAGSRRVAEFDALGDCLPELG